MNKSIWAIVMIGLFIGVAIYSVDANVNTKSIKAPVATVPVNGNDPGTTYISPIYVRISGWGTGSKSFLKPAAIGFYSVTLKIGEVDTSRDNYIITAFGADLVNFNGGNVEIVGVAFGHFSDLPYCFAWWGKESKVGNEIFFDAHMPLYVKIW